MKRAMEDGLSLLAGAGIGMAIMYLMDPETGEQRRARLARKANEAMGGAGEYLGSAVAGASSAASRFGGNVSDRFSDAGDSISGAAQSARKIFSREPRRWWDRAADYGRSMFNRASDTAGDWSDDAGDSARGWFRGASKGAGKTVRQLGSYVPHESEHHYVGQTACALGSLALGAGIIYLFDPDRGRTRRAKLRDKFIRATNETGEFFQKAGKHFANHLAGTYHEARGAVAKQPVDDRRLEERVRSRIGRATRQTGTIEVRAANGRVMLCGTAIADDMDAIVSAVLGVRGVSGIDNQLRAQTWPNQPSYSPQPTAL